MQLAGLIAAEISDLSCIRARRHTGEAWASTEDTMLHSRASRSKASSSKSWLDPCANTLLLPSRKPFSRLMPH